MELGDIMFYLCTPNMSRDSYRSIHNLLNTAFRNILYFSLILILSIPNLYAGEYHNPKERTVSSYESLACSQCHTMHGSQGGESMLYGGSSLQPKLLRHQSILELCLFCHDGITSVAIMDDRIPPDISNNTSYLASAGDFRHSNVDNEANRHSIGIAAPTPPGNNNPTAWAEVTTRFGSDFNCLYCHAQHGNNNYRNLRYDPGNPGNDSPTNANRVEISYAFDSGSMPNDDAKDVNYYGPNVGTNPNKFSRGNVAFRRAPLDNDTNPVRGISAWCGRCHSKFYGVSNTYNDAGASYLGGSPSTGIAGLGDNNAGNPWYRHPVGDITLTIAASSTNLHGDYSSSSYINLNKVRVIEPDSPPVVNGNEQPFCLSCHYAHGGGNPGADQTLNHSNLVKIDAEGDINMWDTTNYNTATPNMRNVCQQCHNQ